MPRRPRPLSRQQRISASLLDNNIQSLNSKSSKKSLSVVENEDGDEDTQSEVSPSTDRDEDDEDEDLDAPRIAQWIGEDELEQSDNSTAGPSSDLVR